MIADVAKFLDGDSVLIRVALGPFQVRIQREPCYPRARQLYSILATNNGDVWTWLTGETSERIVEHISDIVEAVR